MKLKKVLKMNLSITIQYTLMLKPHGDKSPKSAGEKSASEKYALQTLLGWGGGV